MTETFQLVSLSVYKKIKPIDFSELLTNDLGWRIYQSFDAEENDLHFKSKMINDINGSMYSARSILWRKQKTQYLNVMQDFKPTM